MSVSKFLIYELTVSIFCFFVLSHLRQDSPENIRGQENGMIPVYYLCSENKGADQMRGFSFFEYAKIRFSHDGDKSTVNVLFKYSMTLFRRHTLII